MFCCGNCFGDDDYSNRFFSSGKLYGTCNYCGSIDQSLIDVQSLRDRFETLRGVYLETETGLPFLELLKNDWALFSSDLISVEMSIKLLSDILDDPEIGNKRFIPIDPGTSNLENWTALREELLHDNRFFFKTAFSWEEIANWLEHLAADSKTIPDQLYRARIKENDTYYPLSDMGSPPAKKALPGRANPAGIPYLYLASDPKTAISELRPHTGDIACVAKFLTDPKLHFIDLRNPRKKVSPFAIGVETKLILLRKDLGLLDQLSSELTHPVNPKSAHIEYLPSQYLCEFIKHCGYDGVIYRSSVGKGINIALFYPEKAKPIELSYYKIENVTIEVSILPKL
ncbi:MAG: RES family NAD+ phosphorylase [Candidatus Hydrogenedentales bacterium]